MTIDYKVRPSSLREINSVQDLDNLTWKNGYQHYLWLYTKDRELVLLAVEEKTDKFLGYVGVEKFLEEDLNVGYESRFSRSMPPWNHDPTVWHKPHGNVYHITGAAVVPEFLKEGIFETLMNALIGKASGDSSISMIASTYNLRHPTIRNPLKVWGRFDMKPLISTYDPNWNHDGENHSKSTPNDGSIIFARKL